MSDNAIANPTASTDSMAMMGQRVNKRHLKSGFAAFAALALIIGLSAGLTNTNTAKKNVSASQSNKSAEAYVGCGILEVKTENPLTRSKLH